MFINTKSLPPVVLSSSVNVMDQSVALTDTGERIRFTLESIRQWLHISSEIKLVICDGSGFDFTEILTKEFPQAMHAQQIECLFFMNDQAMVAKYGRGYGEGEIMNYALTNSQKLRQVDWFCKCTGKLWVDNFFDCLAEWNGRFLCQAHFAGVFSLKKTSFEYVDTRFYIANKEHYEKYFSQLHLQVGGHFHCSIEDVFKKTIIENNLTCSLFKTFPLVRGVGGASGKYYKGNFIRRNKDRLRLKLVQNDSRFSRWFNLG